MFKRTLLVLSQVVLICGLQSGVAYGYHDCTKICDNIWRSEGNSIGEAHKDKFDGVKDKFDGVCYRTCSDSMSGKSYTQEHQQCAPICKVIKKTLGLANDKKGNAFSTNCLSACVRTL